MVINRGSLHWQSLLCSVPCLISSSHRKTGASACRMSCVSCLIFPFKNYFIKTCIISCDRTLHNSCYRDMGPYQQPICILFCFSLFSSQRSKVRWHVFGISVIFILVPGYLKSLSCRQQEAQLLTARHSLLSLWWSIGWGGLGKYNILSHFGHFLPEKLETLWPKNLSAIQV